MDRLPYTDHEHGRAFHGNVFGAFARDPARWSAAWGRGYHFIGGLAQNPAAFLTVIPKPNTAANKRKGYELAGGGRNYVPAE